MIEPPRKGYTPRSCAANRHTWHALCECGDARVCLRCGVGVGAIPCQCQVGRASDAEQFVRAVGLDNE